MIVQQLPAMDVWVTDGCRSCERTLAAVAGCERLLSLVSVVIRHLDSRDEHVPDEVVGGPAIVFMESVIALGTPTCSALLERVLTMMNGPRSGVKAGDET